MLFSLILEKQLNRVLALTNLELIYRKIIGKGTLI